MLPGVRPSAASGGPTSVRMLYFSGFGATEAVDCYFDTQDIALTVTSSAGAGSVAVSIPKDAATGTHWFTVVGRHSGAAAQVSILIRVDWPQMGFRPTHLGDNLYESVLSLSTADGLQESWRTPDYGSGYPMFSTPAVVGGVVYVASFDGNVYALDATNGVKKWRVAITAHSSSPVVVGSLVYVGSNDNNMYALRIADGSTAWTYSASDQVYSTAAVANGALFFTSRDGSVYSLAAANGTYRWSSAIGGNGETNHQACVANGVVYLGNVTNMYAYAQNTGVLLTTLPASATYGGPVVVNGGLLTGNNRDGTLVRFALPPAAARPEVSRPDPKQLHPRELH